MCVFSDKLKTMIKQILTFIFMIPLLLSGQTFKSGIIVPDTAAIKNSETMCCILSPPEGFSVYDNPKGNVIGTLKRMGNIEKDDQVPYKIYLVVGDKKVKVNKYREIGYELYAINFIDSIDGFVKVLDREKNYWLSVSEINNQGFIIESWMEHLIKKSETVLGYYANEPGLRVRKQPNVTSEIIGSVRGDLFEINLTTNINGKWCRVKITKYKEHPCNSELSDDQNIEYKTEGWMKIIDDNGEPNLFSYTRGC